MQTKLTAALVRRVTKAEPPTRDMSYFDTEVRRLALRVKPPRKSGTQWPSWFFVKYSINGVQRRIKIAGPDTPLEEVRARARQMIARVDAGGDPAAEKSAGRMAWTVREAWTQYAASPDFRKKAPRSQIEDTAVANNHLLRRIGTTKLADINVPSVRRLHRAVESDQRTNSRKRKLGGPGAARRVVRVLSSLLTWCVGEGQLERNPIIGSFRLNGGSERSTILDQPQQYATLFGTMDTMVAEGRLRPMMRAFVTLLAATGMRRDEARTLLWGDIDLSARRITLRHTKGRKLSGKGMATETVSLPPIAAAALAVIRPDDVVDTDTVFIPQRGKLIAVNHDWRRIVTEAGLPADLVLHSLRHSIGTAAILSGMSTAEVSKMLRHRNIAVTARYIHLAESSQSRLQDRAAEHLMPTGLMTRLRDIG